MIFEKCHENRLSPSYYSLVKTPLCSSPKQRKTNLNKQEIIEQLKSLAANDISFSHKIDYFKINLQNVIDALDDNKTISILIKEREFDDSYDIGFHFREF